MAFITGTLAALNDALADARMPNPLGVTDLVNFREPVIRDQVRRLTQGLGSPSAKSRAVHDFVRDRIAYGFTDRFHDVSATQVLEEGIGFSITKSTLLVAMLRALSIPSRLHFASMPAALWRGTLRFDRPAVDHAFAEVWSENRWIVIDSHVVDPVLAARARKQLVEENESVGYGVHVMGSGTWDGRNPAFAQTVISDGEVDVQTDLGVHADARAYMKNIDRRKEGLPKIGGFFFGRRIRAANVAIQDLRDVALNSTDRRDSAK